MSPKSPEKKKPKKKSPALPADRFLNRELCWLAFNQRVLDQAADTSLPLLERAKFLAITSSNLDEFMMVRVGSLKLQAEQKAKVRDPSGLTVTEQLSAVSKRCRKIVRQQYQVLKESLEPLLTQTDIQHVSLGNCSDRSSEAASQRFRDDVLPVLSPQAIFEERPFPLIPGLGIHVCVRLKPKLIAVSKTVKTDRPEPKNNKSMGDNRSDAKLGKPEQGEPQSWDFAIVPLGRSVPRLLSMPAERGHAYVLLEELVTHHIGDFFPGREVVECIAFRGTRNADVEWQEDAAADLLVGMEEMLESRRQTHVIRLEYTADASDPMVAFLSEKMQLRSDDLYPIDGPLDLTYLFTLHGLEGFDSLRDQAWPPQSSPGIDPSESMFSMIRNGDLLMVHPYERFDPVVRMIEEAAVDPDVVAIKQALYRTSRNSPIVAALKRAAEHGKYVSVIVELKARFDEARNIEWAREMERAGVQVIYGIRGLKTHAKVCVIVRREPQGLIRYMHFGTGNYNEVTANLYSDVSLLTCNEVLGSEATAFFNAVTGASEPQHLQRLASAPISLRKRILDLIEAETRRCEEGQQAEIYVKLNALVDAEVIDALYRASQAGVKIRLNIRGVCCLKPGVKGLSETIRVVSIVDRYLEHARVIYFRHGGAGELLISSADWMPRNLDRRIELLVPIEDPSCHEKLLSTLRVYFTDNTNTWKMQSDGSYKRTRDKDNVVRAQQLLYARARKATRETVQSQRTKFQTHVPAKPEDGASRN